MLEPITAVFAAASICAHSWSSLAAAYVRRAAGAPVFEPVSVVIPFCGLEPYSEETIQAAFALDYPGGYELILCVAKADDPIVRVLNKVGEGQAGVSWQIRIGADFISANPKLNNVAKGWRAARHDWIAMVDSNVLMPPDYLRRMMQAWEDGVTGAVSAPAVGSRPENFGAKLECAFLNTYQARWQFAIDTLDFGFAQGKGLLFRRSIVDAGGGIEALGLEIAEDAATTKLVRKQGLRVRLASEPSLQPLGRRPLREVWKRHVRWARMRRKTFPAEFAAEILTSGFVVFGAAAFAAGPLLALMMAATWYGLEMVLAWRRGWPRPSLAALLLRDALLPAIWLAGWLGSDFEWRGNEMSVSDSSG